MKNMPKHVYKPDAASALLQAVTAVVLVAGAVHVFTQLSWHYLPLGWVSDHVADFYPIISCICIVVLCLIPFEAAQSPHWLS